jgi:hypothetical protein
MLIAWTFAICAFSSATACFCSCRERFVLREDMLVGCIEQQFRRENGRCSSQCSVDMKRQGKMQSFHPSSFRLWIRGFGNQSSGTCCACLSFLLPHSMSAWEGGASLCLCSLAPSGMQSHPATKIIQWHHRFAVAGGSGWVAELD